MLPHLRVPFSAPGSLLGVSTEIRKDPRQFHLRTLHRFADPRDLYEILLKTTTGVSQGKPTLLPELLTLTSDSACLEIVFADAITLRFRVQGGSLLLRQVAGVSETVSEGTEGFTTRVLDLQIGFQFQVLAGRWEHGHGGATGHPDRLWVELHPDPETGWAELSVRELVAQSQPDFALATASLSDIRFQRNSEFTEWHERFVSTWPNSDPIARTEAAYIFWSAEVAPRGPLKRRAVYMTKNWMTAIWSWDNCFNAIALAEIDPQLAWDQFMFFFDHQTPGGRLPDLVTSFYAQWGMVKPPIYGWTLRHLRKNPWFNAPERLAEAYEPMARQIRFWFEHRDSDRDGLPEYGSGCDSGWDNGTAFEDSLPTASPDLAAWLVLQLEELAEIAPLLGRAEEAARWSSMADHVVKSITRHCWDGVRWRAVQAGSHRPSPQGDCLLPYLVGLMGHRLDAAQRSSVLAALGDPARFLSSAGVSSESLGSPLYEADGYWRGPVWGPSNVLAAEAASRCGDKELATEIARRFDATCRKSGFAENYDAKTGVGLRDPGYTWTAAAWLMLQKSL